MSNDKTIQYAHPVDGLIIGVDVGGTKIGAGIVDENGVVSHRVRIPTDTTHPESTLQAIASAIQSVMQQAAITSAQVRAVGLGIPGQVDPVNGMSLLAVNLGWRNVAVRDWLERTLNLSCVIDNDVSAATLGESVYGAGRDLKQMVYLSLGTGIAARAIVDGQLYRGAHGMAGEVGHIICDPSGPLCRCGAQGCLEALAAGPALAQAAQQARLDGTASPLLLAQLSYPEQELRSEHVCMAAEQGDAGAQRILQAAARHIAYAIYLLIMTYDPQRVIIGGGLATRQNPFIPAIHQAMKEWIDRSSLFREFIFQDTICLAELQQDAGIAGAAALVVVSR